jgi:hypothetical protein
MSIVLTALAVAFAAFCIWLVVRIINRRERWAKWTLGATLSLPLLYVLSFGPVCWWFTPGPEPPPVRDGLLQDEVNLRGTSGRRLASFYWPLGWLAAYGPKPISRPIRSYATWIGGSIDLPFSRDGRYLLVFRPR